MAPDLQILENEPEDKFPLANFIAVWYNISWIRVQRKARGKMKIT
jgi:hypothetical protein